jgi:hypothetical protein
VLYHLSHFSSPFCSGYFGDGGSRKLCLKVWSSLISVSQVAGITGGSSQPPRCEIFLKAWRCLHVGASLQLVCLRHGEIGCHGLIWTGDILLVQHTWKSLLSDSWFSPQTLWTARPFPGLVGVTAESSQGSPSLQRNGCLGGSKVR